MGSPRRTNCFTQRFHAARENNQGRNADALSAEPNRSVRLVKPSILPDKQNKRRFA